ncbi:hypothetical protein [Sphingomonas sp.]|jgi:hypothetical protein|uniref:hypothetical protein n=1 Tax=Sphingomonas sp. TaxID=28214 RepID=UPI002635EAA3|nr:hypothetical protein [Sphingomonas sp.]MDF2603065.1 hypothetical protein [Sphingomonas sp.]
MARTPKRLKDIVYQFSRPFAFMSVSGPTLHIYRLTLPLIATFLSCAAAWFLPAGLDLVGDKSVSDYMATFFSALPGFFIAALAAVVAFNGGDLDNEMPDVKLSITAHGDTVTQPITLRVFLSYLFAYLTVLSFIGFFVCLVGSLLAPSVTEWIQRIADLGSRNKWQTASELAFTGVVAFVSASVVFCTGQGLYFLAERVHQNLLPGSVEP